MNKFLIITIFIVLLFACKQEQSVVDEEQAIVDSVAQAQTDLHESLSNSQAFYNKETGDTVYVDFLVEFEEDMNQKKLEKYFIVSSYTSYENDEKFKEELARWQELEKDSYVETYGLGTRKKYYISLGRFNTKEGVIPAFQAFQDKYPKEKINFYSIVQ